MGRRRLRHRCIHGNNQAVIRRLRDLAIDPSTAQVSYAQSRESAEGIQFQVADARSMPFASERFDVAVSALVLNFIPDREKAVAEMRRVVRAGGTAAAYVWDFAGRRGT